METLLRFGSLLLHWRFRYSLRETSSSRPTKLTCMLVISTSEGKSEGEQSSLYMRRDELAADNWTRQRIQRPDGLGAASRADGRWGGVSHAGGWGNDEHRTSWDSESPACCAAEIVTGYLSWYRNFMRKRGRIHIGLVVCPLQVPFKRAVLKGFVRRLGKLHGIDPFWQFLQPDAAVVAEAVQWWLSMAGMRLVQVGAGASPILVGAVPSAKVCLHPAITNAS